MMLEQFEEKTLWITVLHNFCAYVFAHLAIHNPCHRPYIALVGPRRFLVRLNSTVEGPRKR